MVHISAIGADAGSASAYARSKATAEAAVTEAFPGAVILRPSIIFGTEDQFFNRVAAMARLATVIAAVGAGTKFQPVYVDDGAEAAAIAATGAAAPGVYELGGPAVYTFRELMNVMLTSVHRRRKVCPLYTSDAADDLLCVDLGGRRIIKKKKKTVYR